MNAKQLTQIGSAAMFGIGVVALCVGLRTLKKSKKAIDNMNKAVDILADKTAVEVSEDIIKAAAEKAADKAAAKAVETVRKDINVKVHATVMSAYSEVEEDVHSRLVRAVERDIDMDELSKTVENKAASKIAGKFMENATEYVGPIMSCIMNGEYKKER